MGTHSALLIAMPIVAVLAASVPPCQAEEKKPAPPTKALAATSTPVAKAEATPAADPHAGMVFIPPGEFQMGSPADDADVYDGEKKHEQPQHPVELKGFWLDKTEVTNRAWEAYTKGHARSQKSRCDDCPVTEVSWLEADAYCRAQQKRLPTEAEWEKAAKGGVEPYRRPEPFGDYAWFSGNSIERTQPVGQKKPNGYGLYDMLGNAREWTADWYDPAYYQQRVRDNPKGPQNGQRRVERGGAFFLPKRGVTPTIRYNHPPGFRLYFLGFRCAKDA